MDGFFLLPFWKVAGVAQSTLLTLGGTFTTIELTTNDFFPLIFRVLFPNLRLSDLFLFGSCIGNNELYVAVMLSFMLCTRVANSSKDFSLMSCKI